MAEPNASPLPSWLTQWDGWDLQFLAGRGYVARAPDDGTHSPPALVDLDGETCGRLPLSSSFGVGWDGSISTADNEPTDGGIDCVIDVWRGVLK